MSLKTTKRFFALSFPLIVGCSEATAGSAESNATETAVGPKTSGTGGVSGETVIAETGTSGRAAGAGRDAASGVAAAGVSAPAGGMRAVAGASSAGQTAVGGDSSGADGPATPAAGATASTTVDAGVGADSFVESSGADCGSSAGALKQNPKLPDPFAMHDGVRIGSKAEWRCRRDEIMRDIEKYEVGTKPAPPMTEASLSGDKLSVKVTTNAGSITLTSSVTASAGSDCVAIGMNVPARLISGCVQIPFMHDQVVKYGNDSSRAQSDPFYDAYPELWDKVSNYAAWSWGISRLIDGIVQLKDELKIDPRKIAVQGCSYAGKMALFAGAFDERIALTIAQESGGGGINSWRTSQDFTARTRTNIEKIDNTNYAWFLASMKQLDPYSLPHDHHGLIAMIAPRAILALGNQDYEWLGDESGWRSVNAAKEVWKALGVEYHIGFDFTSNHAHCSAAPSQVASANAFVDRFLRGQNVDTAIVVEPQEGNFDLEFRTSIDWQTPMLL